MKYIILTMSVLLFIGCSKDDDDNTMETGNTPTVQSQIKSDMEDGSWRITNFNEDGNDETGHFTGYNFTFNTNGTVNASNGENNYSGSWSITDSNSNDDSPNDLDFNLQFNLTNDFEDLNDDWDILSHSDNKMELRDISGGNGGTDLLTFEKN